MKKIAPLKTSLRLLACLACGLGALSPAGAKPKKPEQPVIVPAPPQPMPQSVRVNRGSSVDIPLKIFGTRSYTLEFRIKSPPRSGTLSEVRQVDQEVAAVTYTPSDDLSVKQDRFSFAVRSNEGVSAAADVVITITDAAPQIVSPVVVDFGKVLAGETSRRELEITNRGGGVAEGEIETAAPWSIEGSPAYKLAKGRSQKFTLVFAPESGGRIERDLTFSSQRDRVTSLVGESLLPVAFSVPQLELYREPGDPVRVGAFDLVNNTDAQQTVTLAADARLLFPRRIVLDAAAKQSVLVQTEATDLAPLVAEISVESEKFAAKLPVRAAAVGAIIRAGVQSLNFGQVAPGSGARRSLILRNVGGAAAALDFTATAPFAVTPKTLGLNAGEQREVAIEVRGATSGKWQSEVRATWSAGSLAVPVEAVVTDSPMPSITAAPVMQRTPSTTAPSATAAEPTEAPVDLPVDRPLAGLPATLIERTATTAAIEWPAAQGATRYLVQQRHLALVNHELEVSWLDVTGITPRRVGDQMQARLTGLTPETTYAIRITSFDAEGNALGWPVDAIFQTAPKAPVVQLTASRVLFALLLLCGAGAIYQRRRERAAVS